MMNTRMTYLYRDGTNSKVWHKVIFRGEVTEDDKWTIRNALEDNLYFIPEQVGLPLNRRWDPDPDIDHCFCELEPFEPCTFELTDEEPTDSRNIHELAKAFAGVPYWDAVKYDPWRK